MENVNQSNSLIERLYWLIRLRWVAVVGVVFTVLFSSQILKFSLPFFPFYVVVFVVGQYNLLFRFLLVRIEKAKFQNSVLIANRIANLQVSLDLFSLGTLIHFSGGVENPFIFYFIFHMIIASILLSRRAAYLQATFTVFLFCLIVILEYFGILSHYRLERFIINNQYNNFIYVTGTSFVFISTLYIAVYMATSISRKLREREKRLKEVNELLIEKDHIKSEYVLRVSHHIKEHLVAIQSCIEPVTGGITGSLNDRQMNLLQRADERTEKLMIFVKALLEVTRIKLSKEIKMDYFSVQDMLADIISNITSKAKDKDISIDFVFESSIDKIRGAKEYVQEAISNLLANSVKYTPRNGKIYINVFDKGNSILIQIRDTGIGIPKGEQPRIFDEFYRASNAKEVEKNGTGLGLSITKQVVERHNGKIWVESEEGKGATFFMIFSK